MTFTKKYRCNIFLKVSHIDALCIQGWMEKKEYNLSVIPFVLFLFILANIVSTLACFAFSAPMLGASRYFNGIFQEIFHVEVTRHG